LYAGLFGRLADFLRNDRKSAAVFSGTCRLDRGVECEKVRLIGDTGDGIDDLADLL